MINIDKSGANKAGINRYNKENYRRVKIRQCRYLNNVVEQVLRQSDHRRVKRITRSMLAFQSFHCAQSTFAGIEQVAMLKKGQMKKNLTGELTPAVQFYALAA